LIKCKKSKFLEFLQILINTEQNRYEFIFNFRCGIKIELQDYSVYTAEKIDEAFREFSSLTGEQKLKGTIYCFEDLDGIVRRTYNPEI